MARRKRNSISLERADRLIESIRSINPTLDLGSGLTLEAYTATVSDLRFKLAAYNTALSAIDKLAIEVGEAEQAAAEMSEKMLLGIAGHYGKTSQEYEMAGGSRRKTRRRVSKSAPVTIFFASPSAASSSTNGASLNGTTAATH